MQVPLTKIDACGYGQQ